MRPTIRSYVARPAKTIERFMLADALRRLHVFGPVAEYEYVGMGAHEFIDFELFWRTLGISNMTSIESKEPIERYQFNAPFGGVKVVPGDSKDALPLLEFGPHAILWLDYTKKLDVDILSELRGVARRLGSGSALIASVSVRMDDPATARRTQAIKRLEASRVPPWATDDALGEWGLARLSRDVLCDEVQRAVRERGDDSDFHQLFNFQYADGARMLSWGGLIVGATDQPSFEAARFDELEFVRFGPDPYHLAPPILTVREMLKLNERLMDSGESNEPLPWLSAEDIEAYRRLHRWYPSLP